jgi:hypothetical protein
MPPHSRSRYLASYGRRDSADKIFLTSRKPFRFDKRLKDTKRHIVAQGDTLWNIAFRYYKPFPHAEHLWWVLAEFQPVPIRDLTLDLEIGRSIYVPSLRVVQERALGY